MPAEPSVLEYIKSFFSGKKPPAIPRLPAGKAPRPQVSRAKPVRRPQGSWALGAQWARIPWRSVLAFILFLVAQRAWAPPKGSVLVGGVIALAAVALGIWAFLKGEWRLPELEGTEKQRGVAAEARGSGKLTFRQIPLLLSLFFFGITFLFSRGNSFNFLNVTSWLLAAGFLLAAFWQTHTGLRATWQRLRARLRPAAWSIKVTRWSLLVLAAFALVAFFRFHDLAALPPEMTSDHAEKLLDVYDIQHGQYSIFFTRNAGREPLQFYLTALVGRVFGTGISFLSLKLGTTILAFLSLVYMYWLGKELGGRWVGLFALLLTGLGFWPNLLARIGLRFSLYPTFAAPVLFYLVRGLRRGRLNDFLLSGLFMGIGLIGYTSFRIMPFVAAAALIIFLLHRASPELRRRALIGFALLALVSLVVFTPLLRYMIDNFALFGERMLSRIGESERPYSGSPILTFATNVGRALGMFNVSGGQIWTVGLVRQPAFDAMSAALFLLGTPIVIFRYVRQRHWQDLFLLLAVPLMMLPSTLSIAFPEENPAMNRASGAWIPAFIICAMGMDALLHGLRERLGGKFGLRVAQAAGVALLLITATANYCLFFGNYTVQYDNYSWNTSEMGQVVADYAGSFGSLDSAWVVAYPYWVDTRLVAMNAGYPEHDYGIWPDQLSNTLGVPGPKLFLLKPEDSAGLSTLQQLYPQGILTRHASRVPTKEFLVYFVPVNQ